MKRRVVIRLLVKPNIFKYHRTMRSGLITKIKVLKIRMRTVLKIRPTLKWKLKISQLLYQFKHLLILFAFEFLDKS